VVVVPPERPPFKAVGGWLCLDFVNSVNWDSPERAAERFFDYTDLVRWGQFAAALTEAEAQQLLRAAAGRPGEAAAVYEQALALRATIHRIFAAVANGSSPAAGDLAALNAALAEALAHARLVASGSGFTWSWAGAPESLARPLWLVVGSAAALLTSEQLARVGQCAGESCGWLFLDTSRNRSRRWCEMEHCGNRAKARRHYRRKQAAGSG
jgi:predicted RNA-binding Zn ribbon-like protein